MKFNYKVRTKDGKIQTGVIEASSREGALSLLQDYGFYVTELKEVKEPFWKKIKFFQKVDLKEIASFSRQLSMMFDAKVSLVESLKTLGEQNRNSTFQDKIFDLAEEIEGGTAFSKALSKILKQYDHFGSTSKDYLNHWFHEKLYAYIEEKL